MSPVTRASSKVAQYASDAKPKALAGGDIAWCVGRNLMPSVGINTQRQHKSVGPAGLAPRPTEKKNGCPSRHSADRRIHRLNVECASAIYRRVVGLLTPRGRSTRSRHPCSGLCEWRGHHCARGDGVLVRDIGCCGRWTIQRTCMH